MTCYAMVAICINAATALVVVTGYGSIATAVESVKLGASSYLTKPVDADQVVAAFDSTTSTLETN
jgi:two-component system response regulator RegA